jgi:hypothetical protein
MLIRGFETRFEGIDDAVFGGDLEKALDRFQEREDVLTPIPDSKTGWSFETALAFTSTSLERIAKERRERDSDTDLGCPTREEAGLGRCRCA